jgi:hypothetical protein
MSRERHPKKKDPERYLGAQGYQNKNTLNRIVIKQPSPIKKLLAQRGSVWLFEIAEGDRNYYAVERGELVLRFNLLFQAEAKFLREVEKSQAAEPVARN